MTLKMLVCHRRERRQLKDETLKKEEKFFWKQIFWFRLKFVVEVDASYTSFIREQKNNYDFI